MKWLDAISFRGQFLIPTLIAFAMVLVVVFFSHSMIEKQASLLHEVTEIKLFELAEINLLTTDILKQHSQLVRLLTQQQGQEGEGASAFVAGHMSLLAAAQQAERKLKKMLARQASVLPIDSREKSTELPAAEPSGTGNRSFQQVLENLSQVFSRYHALITEAVGLAKHSPELAMEKLATASELLSTSSDSLHRLARDYAARVQTMGKQLRSVDEQQEYLLVYAFLLLYTMMYAAMYFSSALANNLDAINQAMVSLLKGKTKITLPKSRQKYLRQLIAAVKRFRFLLEQKERDHQQLSQTVAALEQSQQRYRQMFESNQAIKLIIDAHSGEILDCNQAAVSFYGYQEDKLKSMKIMDISVLPKEQVLAEMAQAREQKRLFFNFRHRLARGEVRDVEVYSGVVREQDGRDVFYSIVFDVTERKQAEFALQSSEERFDLAMSVINDGIWDWNIRKKTVFFDDRYYIMLGYQPDEFPSTVEAWQEKVHPDDLVRVRETFIAQIRQGNEHIDIEYRLRHKAGYYLWIRGRGRVIEYEADGKIARILGTNSDVTQRRAAEEALRTSEQHYRALIETTASAAWEYDTSSEQFIYVSPQIEKTTGYEAELWTDLDFWKSHLHPDDKHRIIEYITDMIRQGKDHSYEYRLIAASGEIKWIRSDVHVIHAADRPVILRGYSMDITELKHTEQALQRAQKMEAVGQLTGGIAHDFNNILGVISGNLDLLRQQIEPTEKVNKRLDSIQKAAQRATDLTRQLLGFSRRRGVESSVLDINQVIEGMHDLIERSLTPQVYVEKNLQSDLFAVRLAKGDFEDAMLNLILNARDAMKGRGTLRLATCNHCFTEDTLIAGQWISAGNYVEVSVADTGEGMSEAIQARIFEPFFTTKQQGQGTGLGLAMVFGFVERSMAKIVIESQPGEGATFRLFFQQEERRQADRTDDVTIQKTMPSGTETVLLVDDEVDLLDIARETLDTVGYKVLTATSAEQALVQIEQEQVDIVFSDVVMPGMNGFELAELIHEKYPQVQVLLTSGFSDKHKQSDEGRSRYTIVEKPYSPYVLTTQIRAKLDERSDEISGKA